MSLEAIRVVTVVNRSPSETFDAFLSKASNWWPLDTHSVSPYLGEPAPDTVVLERFEGGKIYEISQSGEHRLWGVILDYEDGKRLTFSWYPGLIEDEATRVSVTFDATDNDKTMVTLVHSGWEARGESAVDMRQNYVTGWDDIIQSRFANYVNAL